MNTDRFGIKCLYPTIAQGREWVCSWDNHQARTFCSVSSDPYDSEFKLRGRNGSITIDGEGIADLRGDSLRMYVYDSNKSKWGNVEVTFYGMRVKEKDKQDSNRGFVVGVRSEHQDADKNGCLAHTYYGCLLYSGDVVFKKELYHSKDQKIYAKNQPPKAGTFTIREKEWIGYKLVVYNIDNNSRVKLLLYVDITDGNNGGDWQKVLEYVDDGNWQKPVSECSFENSQIFLEAGTSVFIRNDSIESAKYKHFSIREIFVTQ